LGTGVVVADIDTGVDPTHPVLQPVLVPGDGYDFTRNQPGGSELNDVNPSDFPTYPPQTCTSSSCPSAAQVNQSTAAVLDQSTADQDTRSQFSNSGTTIVWVAAPGESIVSTYPFATYAAGWGTSFSAPFVSGGAALLRNLQTGIAQSGAKTATAHAVPLADPNMGNGRLDLCMVLGSVTTPSCSQDYSVSATPSSTTITAGQQASFTVSAAPLNGSKQTVTWDCMGAPQAATCTVSPSSVTLNGPTTATATVTLTTTARTAGTRRLLPRYVPPMQLRVMPVTWFALTVIILMMCSFGRNPRQRV